MNNPQFSKYPALGCNRSLDKTKKQISTSICESERYIESLYENTPNLIPLHLICSFEPAYFKDDIDLQTSTNIFKAYIETFEDELEFGPLIGYWWNWDCLTEDAYSYYLVLLFNPTILHYYPMQILTEFGERWNLKAGGLGRYYSAHETLQNISLLSKEKLLYVVRHMLTRGACVRLNENHRINYYGMGDLPKKVEC